VSYLFYGLAVLGALVVIGVPFIDPSLTTTELLLEFWYVYIIAIVVAASAFVIGAKVGGD
jgi:hypothetical protein